MKIKNWEALVGIYSEDKEHGKEFEEAFVAIARDKMKEYADCDPNVVNTDEIFRKAATEAAISVGIIKMDQKKTLDETIAQAKEEAGPVSFSDVPPEAPERDLDDDLRAAWIHEQFMDNMLNGNFNFIQSAHSIGVEMPMMLYGEERPLGNAIYFLPNFVSMIREGVVESAYYDAYAVPYTRYKDLPGQRIWIDSICGSETWMMKAFIGQYGEEYLFALADYIDKEEKEPHSLDEIVPVMEAVAASFERGDLGDGFGGQGDDGSVDIGH